jgi:phage-related protein (TIGR01555 family)
MLRAKYSITNDTEGKLYNAMEKLTANKTLNHALRWNRLFGGCLVVMGIKDGQELDKPVSVSGGPVEWLRIYTSPRIISSDIDIVRDPSSKYFEDIEVFTIQKMDGTIFRVHASRCLIFKGEPAPADNTAVLAFEDRYWGLSSLQPMYDALKNNGAIMQIISNLLLETNIGKFKFSNLGELLASGNLTAIYNRLEIINASKSTVNAVLLGEGEEYSRDSAQLTGVADLIDRIMIWLSSVCEIPVTRLYGRSPAGFNSTGDIDLRNYYDMIEAEQENNLMAQLQYLAYRVNQGVKVLPKDQYPTIVFNPVWTPSQKEQVEMRKQQAETDNIYIQNGVLTAEDVTNSRFANGYSYETTLDTGDIDESV